MNSQTSGLARALGLSFEMRPARMAWPWTWMPMSCVPRSFSTLRRFGEIDEANVPLLAISCGRHGIIPSLALKKQFGERIFTAHIQDPKLDASRFDLVVVPEHDEIRGDNVYLTTGALHHVTRERLEFAARAPEASVVSGDGSRPVATVLIGGPNRYYSFSRAELTPLVEGLKQVATAHDVRLAILGSNRTPAPVLAMFRAAFSREHFVWDGQGSNPYLSALALASHLIVTGDSVSMTSEAAATGKPIFVHHLRERRFAPRFRRFHSQFEGAGITRAFAGRLVSWDYEPPHDVPRIAELIQRRMGLETPRPKNRTGGN